MNPRHFIAHNNLGNLYLGWAQLTDNTTVRRKLLKQAIRECQAALKILPSYVFAHDNLANAHLGLGQFTERLQANASVRCQPIVSVPKALRESLAELGCRCVIHNAVKVETQVGV